MNTFLYWFIQLTWGLPLNIIGAILEFVLICRGHKPQTFGHAIYFEIGNNWGGVNFGAFFFVQQKASMHIKRHEYGHGFQKYDVRCIYAFTRKYPICYSIPLSKL